MEKVRIDRNVQKLQSVDLFYLDTLTDGPTILCLHGRWGRSETWYDFIQHYGDSYRIVAPDQRGHGLSGKPVSKYTADEMSEDMAELLTSLRTGPVIVVGHSMGGRVAGYLAARHPELVRKLAILDKSASGSVGANSPPLDQIPPDPLTKDWPMPFPSIYEAMDFLHREMESELSYQYFMNSLVEGVDGFRMMFSSQAMAANVAYDQSWFHLLPAIRCPVLLVRSSSHESVPDADFEQIQSLLRDCTAHEVSLPDHNVHLSKKEEFYRFYDEFLLKTG